MVTCGHLHGTSLIFINLILQKLPVKLPKKVVINKRVKGDLPFDVAALSDGDLARQLKSFGATVGPITESTRPLYQKKLGKMMYSFVITHMS